MLKNYKRFLKDVPYVIMILGFVLSCNQSLGLALTELTFRTVLILAGLYYPIYFIQLNAIKNGINPQLAFYTVRVLRQRRFQLPTRE